MLGITSHLWADQGRRAFREREVLARTIGDRALGYDDIAVLEEQIDAVQGATQSRPHSTSSTPSSATCYCSSGTTASTRARRP